jgi:hypothetical protein
MAMALQNKPPMRLVDDTPRALIVPGQDDVILKPDDFVNWRGWERLCLGMNLRAEDFKDLDNYKRYFYVAYRITEGIIVVSGEFGSGKSLIMYKIAYDLRNLFGKKCTFDVPPLETFGDYRTIKSAEFTEELEKIGKLAEVEKQVELGHTSREEFNKQLDEVKLFNATIGIDESYDKLEKRRSNNFSINMGHLMMKVRHFHNLFILVSPKANRIDKGMAYDIRSHEIYCSRDLVTNICRYRLWRKIDNAWTSFELNPSNWSHLWKTDNIIGSSILKVRA